MSSPPPELRWASFPHAAMFPPARTWLTMLANRGKSPKTVDAYARGIDYFLAFLRRPEAAGVDATTDAVRHGATVAVPAPPPTPVRGWCVDPAAVTEEHVARYIRHMRAEPGPHGARVRSIESGAGLMNATMQQRITAVRLFYEYLLRKRLATEQPAPRGAYDLKGKRGGSGVLRQEYRFPWLPSDEEWRAFLGAAANEPLRDRLLIALSYDCALRRQEVVMLEVGDLTVATRLARVRAANAKYSHERVVPFSPAVGRLLAMYLVDLHDEMRAWAHRRHDCSNGARARLFTSLSDRNRGRPITLSTWNKTVTRLARPLGLTRFSTHTFRHLRLTDLARANWDIGDIAAFAGHRNIGTTMRYIHLSGRDLLAKVARSTARLHAQSALVAQILAPG